MQIHWKYLYPLAVLLMVCAFSQPGNTQDKVVYAAPKLVLDVAPLSGAVPVDVGFRVVEAFHPWGVESVSVRLLRKLAEDSYFPYGNRPRTDAGGLRR